MVFCQYETALAGERLGQGAQVFFLDELAVDHVRARQLFAQLLQVERLGKGRQAPQQQPDEQAFHGSFLSTAWTKTRGEASSISRLATSTATCTELARVRRSPVAASLIR